MQTLRRIPYYGTLALMAYMPFHIFLAQSLSLLTGGLEAWKIGKDFLAIGLLLLTVILVLMNEKVRRNQKYLVILVLAVAYALIHLTVYLANKDTKFDVALLASTYNNRLFWYLLIGMGGVLLLGKKKQLNTTAVIKVVILASTVVCLLGLLQWFLPKDILSHLGYSIDRGVKPNFFINEDPNFPRVMSTIRDPNSLGAFLLVPIFILVQLLSRHRKKMLIGGLLMLHGLVLLLTFSRAAWGGFIIAGMAMLYAHNAQTALILLKRYWVLTLAILMIGSVGLYSHRQSYLVRSVIFRIDDKNKPTDPDSDQLHYYSVQKSLNGVADKPFGHGPGTAGIVSIQNTQGSFLTENYYLQIAYEVGILGLMVFVAAWMLAIKFLYNDKSILSQALFATAIAYLFMAFVMHLWSNEALSAQWWLLAGVVLASVAGTKKAKKL